MGWAAYDPDEIEMDVPFSVFEKSTLADGHAYFHAQRIWRVMSREVHCYSDQRLVDQWGNTVAGCEDILNRVKMVLSRCVPQDVMAHALADLLSR